MICIFKTRPPLAIDIYVSKRTVKGYLKYTSYLFKIKSNSKHHRPTYNRPMFPAPKPEMEQIQKLSQERESEKLLGNCVHLIYRLFYELGRSIPVASLLGNLLNQTWY